MALDATRPTNTALATYFDNGIKLNLIEAGVPDAKIAEMRANIEQFDFGDLFGIDWRDHGKWSNQCGRCCQ